MIFTRILKEKCFSVISDQIRTLTTATVPAFSQTVAKRTLESDPTKHTSDQIGLFYTIPEPVKQQLFTYGGLPKSFETNIATFNELCLQIRAPALEIIESIKNSDLKRPPVRYVIYGKPGCGKSLALSHVLHYGFLNDFVILHVPWVWNWFRRDFTEVVYSQTNPGMVDLPILAALWLKHFQNQNENILSKLKLETKNEYVWNQREITPAGSQLMELVIHGINRVKYASDAIIALVSELKAASSEKKCKTLVAIDGVNALFGESTNLKTEDKTKVKPSHVTLTKAFLEATKQDWNNGAIVVIVDQMAARYRSINCHLPLFLLGKKGFEHLDPFIPVSVSELTDLEFNSMMDYYEDRKWFLRKDGRSDLAFLTKKNPYDLMRLCGGL